jgi:hypothetical protein
LEKTPKSNLYQKRHDRAIYLKIYMSQSNSRKTFLTYEFWLMFLTPAIGLPFVWIFNYIFAILYFFSFKVNFSFIYAPLLLSQFYFITNILNIVKFKETNFGLRYLILISHILILIFLINNFLAVGDFNINSLISLIILHLIYTFFTAIDILFLKKTNL